MTINPGDADLASEGGHLHSTTLEEGDMLRGSLVLLAGIVAVAGQARAGEGEGAAPTARYKANIHSPFTGKP